jgi:hypothetical protein
VLKVVGNVIAAWCVHRTAPGPPTRHTHWAVRRGRPTTKICMRDHLNRYNALNRVSYLSYLYLCINYYYYYLRTIAKVARYAT